MSDDRMIDFPSDVAALAALSMPAWGQAQGQRCTWGYEVCGGVLACGAREGHQSAGWHGNWGPTWFHAWSEDDDEAFRVGQTNG